MTTPMLTRRAALAGTALTVAAGAFGSLPARAAAPLQGPARPEVYRFRLGAFELTTVLDGAIQLDGPHPIFGQNVTPEEAAALATANFLPADKMEISFTVTLLNTGAQVILFDSGNGAGRRPNAGKLRALVAAAGIAPEQVDVVAMTHFHPDHIGGLMEDGTPAFPNAAYRLGAAEYDFWAHEDRLFTEATQRTAELVQANVVPLAEKAEMIAPGTAVAPGVEAVEAHGHTPGHVAYHIESEGRRLMVTGDMCNHYVMSLQRPDWHVRFDMDKEAAAATRRRVLGMIAADRIPFVGYHMPFPAVGYVEAQGDGFRYVPASYQMNL